MHPRGSSAGRLWIIIMLSKLWQTVKELRKLDREAPKILAERAARATAAAERAQHQITEREKIAGGFTSAMGDALTKLEELQDAKVEEKRRAYAAKLEELKPNYDKIRAKATSGLIDNLEQTLMQGSPAHNSGGRSTPMPSDGGGSVGGRPAS